MKCTYDHETSWYDHETCNTRELRQKSTHTWDIEYCHILKSIIKSTIKTQAYIYIYKKSANSMRCSQVVTLPSTNRTRCSLTAVIRREPVFSAWYGRWQQWYSIVIYIKESKCKKKKNTFADCRCTQVTERYDKTYKYEMFQKQVSQQPDLRYWPFYMVFFSSVTLTFSRKKGPFQGGEKNSYHLTTVTYSVWLNM